VRRRVYASRSAVDVDGMSCTGRTAAGPPRPGLDHRPFDRRRPFGQGAAVDAQLDMAPRRGRVGGGLPAITSGDQRAQRRRTRSCGDLSPLPVLAAHPPNARPPSPGVWSVCHWPPVREQEHVSFGQCGRRHHLSRLIGGDTRRPRPTRGRSATWHTRAPRPQADHGVAGASVRNLNWPSSPGTR